MKKDHASLQRQPFLAPIWLTAVAAIGAAVVLGFSAFTVWAWATAGSTTVVVIRHAEKDLSSGEADPPLNESGKARAALLARMFGNGKALGHLDAIYVTSALRNRLTAAPLAAGLGLTPVVVPADDPRGLARRVLHEHAGGRVLIVGHSDTVPAIVSALSGDGKVPEIADDEYGTLYIVTVPRIGHANLLRLSLPPRGGAQHDGLADEFCVPRDPEIRQYHVPDPPAGVDEVGGSTHADPQRPVDPVHFDDGLLLIREQHEGQAILGLELGMRRGTLRTDADDPHARLLDFRV